MENIVDYEESEAYMEAKLYMERLEQENPDENEKIQKSEDPSEHRFSLTVIPVTVPCAPLSYATVQWDVPEIPAEPPLTGWDSGTVNDVDFSTGSELDWTLNLSSTDSPDQEFLPETEQQPDVTLPNQLVLNQELEGETQIVSSVTVEESSSGSVENSSDDLQVFTDTQISNDLKELVQESLEEIEMKEHVSDLSSLTLIHQEHSILDTDEKTEEQNTPESNEEPDPQIIVQDEISVIVEIKDEPLEHEETDLLNKSDQSQINIITEQATCRSAELELTMDVEPVNTSVVEMELNDTFEENLSDHSKKQEQPKYAEEPESSVQELENSSTESAKPFETESPEDIDTSKTHSSDDSEQIVCSDQKESSEEMKCSDEEKPELLENKTPEPREHPEDRNHIQIISSPTKEQESVRRNGSVKVPDRAEAQRLAERLYRLEGFNRTDVVRHLDKDNEFSKCVGEEYLKYFDFTDQSLEQALRSFLKEVVLIGETQERERVLQHFSSRFQECNPDVFSSSSSVLTLTCALMLLNTDLHGQNVGKPMSLTEFISNLEGMNGGENFNKDCLKSLYNSIKSDPLRWAVEEDVLTKSITLEQDSEQRSKSNPFQDLPHNKKAVVFQKGFLKRKAHADIDGKRTPWGKRKWKTFYAVLKGMVLYLQKDEYQRDWHSSEEVVSVHHALAEPALNYTKRPHVFRLQTADWRVFLFEASSTEQMNSWIGRINLVSALYSSPPFPAAVGSQKKFCRPILPASHSNLTLDKQQRSHTSMLESFQRDLNDVQQGTPDGRKTKARESEEIRLREEYLQYEKSRYEVYLRMLEAWQTAETSQTSIGDRLNVFDEGLWRGETDETEGVMKRSLSSPSLELEVPPQPTVKVRRNISERRTYRKIIIPRRNKEL